MNFVTAKLSHLARWLQGHLTRNAPSDGMMLSGARLMQRFVWLLVLVFISGVSVARADVPELVRNFEQLFAPGQSWLDVKLKADTLADPSSNAGAARLEYQQMSFALRELMEQKQPRNAHEKLTILRSFIYEAGPWNGFRPFSYDMDDPFGKMTAHKTLSHYLTSRKGNCISMPILLALLGRDIGLNMRLAVAPLHMFVKFTDDEGKVWNVEATSGGGYARDIHYRRELPMTDRAVETGVYMRLLSEEESVAAMSIIVLESLVRNRRWGDVIAVSEAILKRDQRQIYTIISRASAYGRFMDTLQKARQELELPLAEEMIQAYYDENQRGFAYAENLGWTENDGLKELWPPQGGE